MSQKRTPPKDPLQSAAERIEALQDDPLKGRFYMDIFTLNLVGETALGDRDEGTFTTAQLAESFHQHLEKIYGNELVDSRGDRKNLVRVLELNLRTVSFEATISTHLPDYVCLGTVFLKRVKQGQEVAFSFQRHPLLEKIFAH